MEDRHKIYDGNKMLLDPVYVQARQAFYDQPLAPDANGTLRVTYGTVRGYRPAPESPMYEPFTTLSSLIAKHTGTKPFNAPDELLEAAKTVSPDSSFFSESINDIPVNFLSDLDITGGNSGSATLNRKGELVGLIFDGNSEALASNLLFMPDITRSIHVDIRYVLWVMKHVDGAHRLLEEMGCPEAWIEHHHKFDTFDITTSRFISGNGKIQIEHHEKPIYTQEGYGFFIHDESEMYKSEALYESSIPIGTDITGNGKPNFIYYEWSGGAHCCNTATILELGKSIKKIAVIEGNHSIPEFVDCDNDGIYEISLIDWTYDYFPQSFAYSPRPRVVLKWKNGKYTVAPEYMVSPPPNEKNFMHEIKIVDSNDLTYPSSIMGYAINLMYDGHEQLGWDYINKAWPKGEEQRKTELVTELKELMNRSPYWNTFKKSLNP
jgi:hypothetical protein